LRQEHVVVAGEVKGSAQRQLNALIRRLRERTATQIITSCRTQDCAGVATLAAAAAAATKFLRGTFSMIGCCLIVKVPAMASRSGAACTGNARDHLALAAALGV
jgi:hypothetical protein